MVHGGKRRNSGRKRGTPNKDRAAFIAIINEIAPPEKIVAKLKELADGVTCVKYDNEGEPTIYERPPDSHAAAYLLDQAFGKAKQSIEVEASVDVSWEEMLGLNIGSGKAKK